MNEQPDGNTKIAWTAAGCVEFLDAAAEKGWINPASAKALRVTFGKVMSIDDGWEQKDLRDLNLEEHFDRFRTLRRNEYSDGSLRVYQSRFQQALRMYLARLNNDQNWKSYGPSPRSSGGKGKVKTATTTSEPTTTVASETPHAHNQEPINLDVVEQPIPPSPSNGYPPVRQIDHVFPLRDDLDVTVRLPRDLTSDEADALTTFISSLVRRPTAKDAYTRRGATPA